METQKALNSQNNFEKEQYGRYHASLVQTLLHSHSNQNSMGLEQKTDTQINRENRIERRPRPKKKEKKKEKKFKKKRKKRKKEQRAQK